MVCVGDVTLSLVCVGEMSQMSVRGDRGVSVRRGGNKFIWE